MFNRLLSSSKNWARFAPFNFSSENSDTAPPPMAAVVGCGPLPPSRIVFPIRDLGKCPNRDWAETPLSFFVDFPALFLFVGGYSSAIEIASSLRHNSRNRFECYDGGDANAARGSSPSLLLSCHRGFGLDEIFGCKVAAQ